MRHVLTPCLCCLSILTATQTSAFTRDAPDCLSSSPSASEAIVTEVNEDQETDIWADTTFTDKHGNTVFSGDVVIQQAGRKIMADRVTYDSDSGAIKLDGNIVLSNRSISFSADTGDFNTNDTLGSIANAEFILRKDTMRGRADRISLDNNDSARTTLDGAAITSCPEQKQDWLLSADNIELNHSDEYGKAEGAVLEFKGVPFLYLPYMEFPIGDRRRSGLLIPTISNSDKRGFELSVPWYWNIAPNHDATFAPTSMSKRGLRLDTEYRFLTRSSEGILTSEYLDDDKLLSDKRYYTRYEQHTRISDSVQLEIDAQDVSDISYFDDFSSALDETSQSYLGRQLLLSHRVSNWHNQLLLQSFETIDNNIVATDRPYRSRPQLSSRGSQQITDSGLQLTLDAHWAEFEHEDSSKDKGSRLVFSPGLTWPMQGNYWFVKPALQMSYTQYEVEDGAGNPLNLRDRNMLISSIDSGLIFERDAGDDLTQTLEPRLFYLNAPYRDQSAYPLFDTGLPTFSFDRLFNQNRFSGYDRLNDANQLTTALTTRFIDDFYGTELFSASIGQISYFEDRQVSLSGGTETETRSDLVAELAAQTGRWSARAAIQWDRGSRRSERENFLLQYKSDNEQLFNLSYRELAAANPADEISQSDVSFVTPMTDNTIAFGRWNYSHTEHQDIDVIAGIGYESCCWSLHVLAQRQRTDSASNTYDNSIMLQFVLKGLGSVSGDQLDNTLRNAIRNY